MQRVKIAGTIHKRERAKSGQAPRRAGLRKQISRQNIRAVVWYGFLTVAGVLLYKAGAAYALRERGYYAVGGEAFALLLPVLYCAAVRAVRDIVREFFQAADE